MAHAFTTHKTGALPFSRSLREGEAFTSLSVIARLVELVFHSPGTTTPTFCREQKENHGKAVRRTLTSEGLGLGCPAPCRPLARGGEEGAVEIESRWTARRREQLGAYPAVRRRDVS